MTQPTAIEIHARLKDQDVLQFNGSTTEIDVGDPGVCEGNSFTVEAFVKVPARGGAVYPTIYSEGSPANWGDDRFSLLVGDLTSLVTGAARVYIRDSSSTVAALEGVSDLRDGNWHHVVVRQNSKSDRDLIVDLIEEDNDTTTIGALAATDAYIGAVDDNVGMVEFCAEGTIIREVRAWSDARNDAELKEFMEKSLVGNESNLVAYWKIDEGSGSTANDSDAGGSYDGTITGGTWLDKQEDQFWTDLSVDVIGAPGVSLNYGSTGQRPTDVIAKTGKLKFTLNNSSSNSGSQEGWYSPEHASARAGWNSDTAIRIMIESQSVNYYKWIGKVDKIKPVPGTKRSHYCRVLCRGWMDVARRFKTEGLEVLEDVRSDQVIETVIRTMTEQPRRLSFAQGQEDLPSALDDLKEGKTTAGAIFQRVMISEGGHLSPIGDTIAGGTLQLEDRHARQKITTLEETLEGGEIAGIKVESDPNLLINIVNAKIIPRVEGVSPEILASLETALEIAPGESIDLKLSYRDPDSPDVKISGKDLWDAEGQNELVEHGIESGFESGAITGWSESTSDTMTLEVAAPGEGGVTRVGTYAMKIITGTGASDFYYAFTGAGAAELLGGFAQGDIVYLQAFVYLTTAPPAGEAVRLIVNEYDAGGGFQVQSIVDSTDVSGGWVRLKSRFAVVDVDTASIAIAIGYSPGDYSGGAEVCYIDQVYAIHDTGINFEFSSSDAGGGDMNEFLDLTGSVIGGSGTDHLLYNESSSAGFVTALRAIGTAIRRYDSITKTAEDADRTIDRPFDLNLYYVQSTRKAEDRAEFTLQSYGDPIGWVKSVTFHANRSAALMLAALAVEPGQRVKLIEAVTGISNEYFVNGVRLRIRNKMFIDCTWSVIPASTDLYWLMGVNGRSNIGISTYVGI